MLNIVSKTARELLNIEEDVCIRLARLRNGSRIDQYELYVFPQTWASTALGFDGCGGSAMTTANTYVFLAPNVKETCFVYFRDRFAYAVPLSEAFWHDLKQRCMVSVREAGKYKE